MRGFDCIYRYLVSFSQLFCIFMVALFLPKLFVLYASMQGVQKPAQRHFKLGIENISGAVLRDIQGNGTKKNSMGLVTNHTGRDQSGVRTIDILVSHGINVAYVFTPKHGYFADKQLVARQGKDSKTNIPIIDWHDLQQKKALSSYIRHTDLLLFDVQDSGLRHGYVGLLLNVMKVAQQEGKKLIVFDRPNLLGCGMEGTDKAQHAIAPSIPLRHGMTIGELALYFNAHSLDSPADLQVVPMDHYQRGSPLEKPLLACNLSPNIPTIDACYGYSFLGLMGEVAPFDVGLGTSQAFQCLALPESLGVSKSVWHQVRALLKERGIESQFYRYASKRKKGYCSGLLVTVNDINEFGSVSTFLDVLKFFKKKGVKIVLSPHFDAIFGTDKVRSFLEGTIKRADLATEFNTSVRTFLQKAAGSFIYTPLPKLVPV